MNNVKLFVKDMALGMTGLINLAFGVLGLASGKPFFQAVGGLFIVMGLVSISIARD